MSSVITVTEKSGKKTKLSTDELLKRVANLEKQAALVDELQKKNAELEARASKSSRVSTRVAPVREPWNFPVEIAKVEKIMAGDRKLGWEGQQVVFNPETNKIISLVSERYSLLKNDDLLGRVEETLKTLGFNSESAEKILYTSPDGTQFHGKLIFRNKVHNISKLDDKMAVVIELFNDYAARRKMGISTSAERLVCKNGQCLNSDYFAITKRHVESRIEEINPELIKLALEKAIEGFDNNLETLAKFAEIELSDQQCQNLFGRLVDLNPNNIPIFGKRHAKASKELWLNPTHEEDKQFRNTLYGVNNSITQYLTHSVRAKGFFEVAQKASEHCFFKMLEILDEKNGKNALKNLTSKPKTNIDEARSLSVEPEAVTTAE